MLRSDLLLPYLRVAWIWLFLSVSTINAQSWQWVEQLGGWGNENFEGMATGPDGRLVFAGSYEEIFSLAGQPLPEPADRDIFIAATEADGTIRWVVSAGSPFEDAVAAVSIDREGAVLCAGTFWQEAVFSGQRIRTSSNLKGIFLAKYGESGALQWVKAIDGSQLKEVTDVKVDSTGSIYLTGFFQEALQVDDTVLNARGDTDLFLLKFDASGKFQWASTDGYSGDTRALSMTLIGEEIVLGGIFNDTTDIGGQQLTANTFDRDVFLARYDKSGRAKWARKAGGVHEDELAAVTSGPNEDIYLTGSLVGVMKLNDKLSIQSRSGQSDFYLLRYSGQGEPLTARAMGGERVQQATDLERNSDGILLSGIYQGTMTIDLLTVSAGTGFGSFIAQFDKEGNLNWIKNLPTEDAALVTDLATLPENRVWVGGAFRGNFSVDGFDLSAPGHFDLILGHLRISTTTSGSDINRIGLQIFPNPANQHIYLETASSQFTIDLFGPGGRKVLSRRNTKRVQVGHLPAGIYILQYTDEERIFREKLVITR